MALITMDYGEVGGSKDITLVAQGQINNSTTTTINVPNMDKYKWLIIATSQGVVDDINNPTKIVIDSYLKSMSMIKPSAFTQFTMQGYWGTDSSPAVTKCTVKRSGDNIVFTYDKTLGTRPIYIYGF